MILETKVIDGVEMTVNAPDFIENKYWIGEPILSIYTAQLCVAWIAVDKKIFNKSINS